MTKFKRPGQRHGSARARLGRGVSGAGGGEAGPAAQLGARADTAGGTKVRLSVHDMP